MPVQKILRQAMSYQREGRLKKAQSLYREILEAEPNHPDALHLYGLACHQLGDHETAVRFIGQAVKLVPEQPVLRNNLGDALRRAGRLQEACRQLTRALELQGDYAGAHLNLGSAWFDLGDRDKALHHAREATALEPGHAGAWYNLGLVLLGRVDLEKAARAFRRALEIRPAYSAAAASYLYTLNLLPGVAPGYVADEHRSTAAGLYGGDLPVRPQQGGNDCIRIGFISGDFRSHAVNHFFEPVLENLDRGRFDTWCYSDVIESDSVTHRLQGLADHWCDIQGLSDEAVVQRVRAEEIDILVDLAGFTRHGRPGVFAGRAAACQIGWLGYPGTTGLAAIDFRVVDAITAPENEIFPGVEKALCLPGGFACFRPPAHAPDVSPAPCRSGDYVTLGSFHKLDKLNELVLETWAAILSSCGNTRLLLLRDELDDWQQRRITATFRQHGIGAERLKMIQFDPSGGSFLEHFAEIDLQLDTFPWSGHTMACQALWMGVPVVTLRGNSHAGRMVASVLSSLGLDALVAGEPGSYVSTVVDLCRDPERLVSLRTDLRQRMQSSPLMDEPAFTRQFEESVLAAVAKI